MRSIGNRKVHALCRSDTPVFPNARIKTPPSRSRRWYQDLKGKYDDFFDHSYLQLVREPVQNPAISPWSTKVIANWSLIIHFDGNPTGILKDAAPAHTRTVEPTSLPEADSATARKSASPSGNGASASCPSSDPSIARHKVDSLQPIAPRMNLTKRTGANAPWRFHNG